MEVQALISDPSIQWKIVAHLNPLRFASRIASLQIFEWILRAPCDSFPPFFNFFFARKNAFYVVCRSNVSLYRYPRVAAASRPAGQNTSLSEKLGNSTRPVSPRYLLRFVKSPQTFDRLAKRLCLFFFSNRCLSEIFKKFHTADDLLAIYSILICTEHFVGHFISKRGGGAYRSFVERLATTTKFSFRLVVPWNNSLRRWRGARRINDDAIVKQRLNERWGLQTRRVSFERKGGLASPRGQTRFSRY